MKLKDVLYGCCECGLYTCECDDAATEENIQSPPPAQPFSSSVTTSAPQHPPPPTGSGSPPTWTPPPTPPCTDCGGVNYGPSPGSLCFNCIPPLEIKTQPTSCSPSKTPPGTPPSLRLVTASRKSQTRELWRGTAAD